MDLMNLFWIVPLFVGLGVLIVLNSNAARREWGAKIDSILQLMDEAERRNE